MKLSLGPSRPAPAPRPAPEPYVGEELVQLLTDAGPLWIPAADGVMRPFLEERGTWEPEEGMLLSEFFRPGLRFLDVGANVGYFSLFAAKHCPGARVHAFEPHPLTSKVLALNAWASNADITSHALALSDGDRVLALTTAESNLGDTRARATGAGTSLSPAAPLDEVLPAAVFDLVKIDVQGFEPEVIGGMAGMLERSPGVVVVAEFWPSALRERDLDPIAVLHGYRKLGLQVRGQVGEHLSTARPVEMVRICDQAGPNGQINLVLTRAGG
ncbi:FkbM family methyltransferase [Nocardioides anomalus]|uniref:FkbM family methyltransferase n=1 Tax=Nocardioides anomalus TaxID=2712223 RepID=A0A6G6WI09_9ACTN|nr:FkbM family methyltransferase [Nocardioides anomalus]QIG44797.1 FkbM family methyltransferase [Nocardioides anomalus]